MPRRTEDDYSYLAEALQRALDEIGCTYARYSTLRERTVRSAVRSLSSVAVLNLSLLLSSSSGAAALKRQEKEE